MTVASDNTFEDKRRGLWCRTAAVLAVAVILAGCSSSPDEANSGDAASGANASEPAEGFPNLSSVPGESPETSSRETREGLSEGLSADRSNARYSDQSLTAESTLIPPAPPPPSAPKRAEVTPAPRPAPSSPAPSSEAPARHPQAQRPQARRQPPRRRLRHLLHQLRRPLRLLQLRPHRLRRRRFQPPQAQALQPPQGPPPPEPPQPLRARQRRQRKAPPDRACRLLSRRGRRTTPLQTMCPRLSNRPAISCRVQQRLRPAGSSRLRPRPVRYRCLMHRTPRSRVRPVSSRRLSISATGRSGSTETT